MFKQGKRDSTVMINAKILQNLSSIENLQEPISPTPINPSVGEKIGKKGKLKRFIHFPHREPAVLNPKFPSIDVQSYTKRFKKFNATKDMTFTVGQGVIHGFIGPNGSGKTTAIKAMIGAYIPTKGKILINGHKAGTAAANRLIGYIPERASFPKYLNTIEYLVTMAKLSGLSSKEAKSKSMKILQDLGLAEQAKRRPTGFSSGMQKKILLAQSLIINPSILILDEPAANLDPTARKSLFDDLLKLRNEGKTILISSHILSELERIIDEVTFVYYGDVIYTGTIQDLLASRSDVFIKTSNNQLVYDTLKEKTKLEVKGDIKTEIAIGQLSQQQIKELYKFLGTIDVEIRSFRANDLQSIYDYLTEKSAREKKGSQSLKGKRVVSMREDKS